MRIRMLLNRKYGVGICSPAWAVELSRYPSPTVFVRLGRRTRRVPLRSLWRWLLAPPLVVGLAWALAVLLMSLGGPGR